MAQDVTIALKIKDGASKALAKAGEAFERLQGRVKGTSTSGSKFKGVQDKLAGAAGRLSPAIMGVVAAGAAATAMFASLYKIGQKALTSWQEQSVVNANLADSLSRAGVAGDKLDAVWQSLNARAGEMAGKTMFGDEDILAGMSKYIQLSGKAKIEQDQLSTILGIAAKQKMDTAAAAELYAKAMKGEIGPLKDVTSLTKEQEDALNKIKDPTEKAAKAHEILAAQFKGVAEQVNPTFNAIKNLEDAQGDLWQMMGSVIDRSGTIPAVLEPVTAGFREVEKWVDQNHVTLQRYLIRGVMFGSKVLRGFFIIIDKGSELIGGSVVFIWSFIEAFKIMGNVVLAGGKVVAAFVGSSLVGLINGLDGVMGKVQQAASVFDDELAAKIGNARKGLTDFQKGVEEFNTDAMKSANKDVEALKQNVVDMSAKLDKRKGIAKSISTVMQGAIEKTSELDSKLAKLEARASKPKVQSNVKKQAPPSLAPTPESQSKGKGKKEDLAKRNELARRQLEILNQTSDIQKANLELNLKLWEVDNNKKLTTNERLLQQKQAEIEHANKLKDIEKARYDAQVKKEEEAKKLKEENLKIAQEQMRAEVESLQALGSSLDRLASGANQINRVGQALSALVEQSAEFHRIQSEMNQGLITGAQATEQALSSLGQASAIFAEKMGASAKAQAGILALFELAAALASFAAGDYFGGGQHLAASAIYGMVAATSPSASAATTAPTQGGSSPGPAPSPDVQRQREDNADLLAERLGRVMGGGDTINLNYTDNSTNIGDDPKKQDELLSFLDAARRRRGDDPNNARYRRD